MKDRKIDLGSLIGGIALVVIGILVMCNQNAFVKILVICAGIAALADGVYTLYVFRQWQFVGITRNITLAKGIIMTVSGLIGIVMPLVAAITVVTVICYIFGAILVYSAYVSVQDAVVIKKLDKTIARGHFYVEAIFSLIIAVIFFIDPSKILSAVVLIVSIATVVTGVGFVIYSFLSKR